MTVLHLCFGGLGTGLCVGSAVQIHTRLIAVWVVAVAPVWFLASRLAMLQVVFVAHPSIS